MTRVETNFINLMDSYKEKKSDYQKLIDCIRNLTDDECEEVMDYIHSILEK